MHMQDVGYMHHIYNLILIVRISLLQIRRLKNERLAHFLNFHYSNLNRLHTPKSRHSHVKATDLFALPAREKKKLIINHFQFEQSHRIIYGLIKSNHHPIIHRRFVTPTYSKCLFYFFHSGFGQQNKPQRKQQMTIAQVTWDLHKFRCFHKNFHNLIH